MNTRLQVEHPVTELVTGIDLVEQMIRVAAGEKLSIRQQDVTLSGWAVESRVYAEDPYRNFLPSIGRLVKFRPPAETSARGRTVRVDTGVYEGGEISLFYDPMIAKLITHAKTREVAIEVQADALDAFTIEGIRHNIPFLAAVMQHPRWREGRLATGFIAEEYPDGFHPQKPEGETARVLAAVATAIDHVLGERKRKIAGQLPARAVTRERSRVVQLNEGEYQLDVVRAGNDILVSFFSDKGRKDNARVLASAWKPGDVLWAGTIDGRPISVHVRPIFNGFELAYRGVEAKAFVYTAREAEAARLMPAKKASDSGKALRCPMPGLVVSIAVAEGQEVKAGETLAVVEAMKMENVLRAERDGVVKKIHAKPGESLAVDAVILEFA
jgi:propionyl-CoA carboxylase alpha chain